MNKTEARKILAGELARYRVRSYAELLVLLDRPDCYEVDGSSGARYQVEIRAVWDKEPEGVLRVLGFIDDRGWRAFVPLSDDFLVAPDGSLVGE